MLFLAGFGLGVAVGLIFGALAMYIYGAIRLD